jgi:hypothetical protein
MPIYINRILYDKSGDAQEVWQAGKEWGGIFLTGCRNSNEKFRNLDFKFSSFTLGHYYKVLT